MRQCQPRGGLFLCEGIVSVNTLKSEVSLCEGIVAVNKFLNIIDGSWRRYSCDKIQNGFYL